MKSLRPSRFVRVFLILMTPSMFMSSGAHGATTSAALTIQSPSSIEAIIHRGAISIPESQKASYYSGAIVALNALQENLRYTIASLLSFQANRTLKVPLQTQTTQTTTSTTTTKTTLNTQATLPASGSTSPTTGTTSLVWEPLVISKDRPITYYYPDAAPTTARAYVRLLSYIGDPKYKITGPLYFGMYSYGITWNSMSGSCAEAEAIARASCQNRNTGRAWSRNSINYKASWADSSTLLTTSKTQINYNLISADLVEVLSCSNDTIKYRCSGYGYILEPLAY